MEQNQLDTFRQTLISLRDDIEHLTNDSSEAAATVEDVFQRQIDNL